LGLHYEGPKKLWLAEKMSHQSSHDPPHPIFERLIGRSFRLEFFFDAVLNSRQESVHHRFQENLLVAKARVKGADGVAGTVNNVDDSEPVETPLAYQSFSSVEAALE